jgi:hypothetical protein
LKGAYFFGSGAERSRTRFLFYFALLNTWDGTARV